ncbi:MAG TPA: ABC transporter permease [Abditibacteriaceae bacterium]|jgi:ABC-type antimicrobial peptide transport system permease subunit|nr:ABC transporter permease [Abditibacteriaceae bacterium]
MTLRDKAGTAMSNLGRRKVRTVLTSIGVVVGIMTVVTMISLVNGVRAQVRKQFEEIGLDRVVVSPRTEEASSESDFDPFQGGKRSKLITVADVKRWKAWPEVRQIEPQVELPFGIEASVKRGTKIVSVRLTGEGERPRGPFAGNATAVAGLSELPPTKGVMTLSRNALEDLGVRKNEYSKLLGKPFELTLYAPRGEKKTFRLKMVGISDGRTASAKLSAPDRLAIKSWWLNAPDLLKSQGYDSVNLQAIDVSAAKLLVTRLRREKYQVQSIDAILNVADRVFSVITAMLALVSSVALLVACIGIVNTMIMSIYERTREIGTLKAMGASRGDIRQMFMMEAGLIGLMGGMAGLVLSWILGRGLNTLALYLAKQRALPLPDNLFIITPTLIVQALFFALLIGILAGVYPANRAARLDPLAALRHE